MRVYKNLRMDSFTLAHFELEIARVSLATLPKKSPTQ